MSDRKLLFAVDCNSFNKSDHIGVRKKVYTQIECFAANGINSEVLQYDWENGLPNFTIGKEVDILYFRTIGPSIRLALMLRRIKKNHVGLKIIMEIPTYPIENKRSSRSNVRTIINEVAGRELWRICIDRIVFLENYNVKKIYGVRTLHATNGILFNHVKKRNYEEHKGINLIAVSGCFLWHGYDRIIKGLNDYYICEHNIDVNLFIVGDGECRDEYIALAEEYKLNNEHIFFFGIKDGKELDDLYDMADIALECFGAHRKGMTVSASLKSREYAAKGMPIVTSVELDIEDDNTRRWICRIPSDESNVDIQRIIEFYENVYGSIRKKDSYIKVAECIRETYRKKCDINSTFGNVIEYMLK